jgi:beta-fructofuranosidase
MGVQSLPWRLHADGDDVVALPHPVLQKRRSGEAPDGVLPSVADIEWPARPGDVVVAADLFELEALAGRVAVTLGGVRHEMPWAGAPLRVVLDGPVLEMFGDRGVLAAPVPATGRDAVLSGATDRTTVHRLG